MSDKKVHSVKRAVEVAARAFAFRKFNEVTVAEISQAAQCSTTTIYAIFGNKEGLFLEAMTHLLQTQVPEVRLNNRSALCRLVSFAEARVRSLSSPVVRGAVRAISGQIDTARTLVDHLAEQQCGKVIAILEPQIDACVQHNLLRPLGSDNLAYAIMAVTAYEPIVFGMLYGNDQSVDITGVLRKAFTPLVTPSGEVMLTQLLDEGPAYGALSLASRNPPQHYQSTGRA